MTIIYSGSGGGVPRKTAKIFAENADVADVTEFGSTLAGSTVTTSDIADIQNSAFETGWRDAVISDLNYPLMGDMNGVQKVASQQIAYMLQHGVPEWDSATEYYAYDIVAKNAVLYVSLVDENTNNDVSDTNYWAVYYDPNDTKAKRNVGELVFSLLPLSSTDLHLCDGALIQNNGIYIEFCQWIATLYNDADHTYDNCFCSEADWQTSVSTYGVCGKFVYDSINATVRLPKLTGMVEGTLSLSAITDLQTAGLPSFTHTHGFSGTTGNEKATHTHSGTTGAMNSNASHSHSYTAPSPSFSPGSVGGQSYIAHDPNAITGATNIDHSHNFTSGAESVAHQHDISGTTGNNSAVSGVYGNSTTVQPQTIKGFYYIVVTNTVASTYTIQWDNVATDLANKVSKTGDTMTGDLTINKNVPGVYCKSPSFNITSSTAPASDAYAMNLQASDTNGNFVGHLGIFQNIYNDFIQQILLQRSVGGVMKYANICLGINSLGADYATATSGVKQSITNWAFPSNRYDDLILGVSGSTYIAPGDGWFVLNKNHGANTNLEIITMENYCGGSTQWVDGLLKRSMLTVSGISDGVYMPAKKGDTVIVHYSYSGTTNAFRFYYAVGG